MADDKIVWSPLPGSQTLAMSCPAQIIVYHGSRGPGKSIANEINVLCDSGFKPAGDITYDDKLVAIDGTYVNVLGIYPQGVIQLYDVEFFDGEVVEACAEHRWLSLNNKTGYREGWKVRTTKQIMEMKVGCSVPYLQGGIQGKQWCGIDPYMLGYIIANGTTGSRNVTIYSIDEEILEYAKSKHGWSIYRGSQTANRAYCPQYQDNLWREALESHKIGDKKCVPKGLLESDPETRLALLQGLMDGDGSCESGAKSRYSTVSEQLAKDVVYLVKSLGGWANYRKQTFTDEQQSKRIGNREGSRNWIYRVDISHHNKFNPFRLERKASQYKEQKTCLTRGIKSITPSRMADAVCFAVEHPDHCFIVGDFVVTHNTDSQLMRFRSRVGQGYGRHWRGIIFDREYKNLDDLVSKSMRWFPEFKDGCRFINSKSDYKWVWKTGEELLFRTVKKDQDYWSYHGQEFPFIGWNELTKYPTGNLFEMMMSCNRSSFRPEDFPFYINGWKFERDNVIEYVSADHRYAEQRLLPEISLEVFATCNPHGTGHNWIKKKFINASPMGKILRNTVNVYNPRTQKREDVVKTQVHIFGSYRENKYLSPEYVATLESIDEPNKKKAWLHGDWDVVAGGMFDDLWDTSQHVVTPFKIPESWRIDRSFDWGSSAPFSVGWWAESDGSEVVLPNGKIMSTIRGDIFRIKEWYGSNGRPNEGLRMLDEDIAAGIVEREISSGLHLRVVPGPADGSIFNVENGNSTAARMAAKVKVLGKVHPGVTWMRADKSSGSRKAGWGKLRTYLRDAKQPYLLDQFGKPILDKPIPREKPGLFVFNTCKNFIDLVPCLPRSEKDPDDVDCFVAGTLISCPSGEIPIEELKVGDFVNTPIGPRQLLKAGIAGKSSVITIELSNGKKLTGTLDHKIYVENYGLRPLCKLLLGDILLTEENLSWLKSKSIMEYLLDAIPMLKRVLPPTPIFHVVLGLLKIWDRRYYTALFGELNAVKFQKDSMFTTKIMTRQIIALKTLNYYLQAIMQDTICKNDLVTVGICKDDLMLGEKVTKDKQYLKKILKNAVKILPSENLRALIVATILQHNTQTKKYAILKNVLLKQVERVQKRSNALFVVLQYLSNHILQKKCKPVVVNVDGTYAEETVYYLTIEQAHLFYANGILSTNTEAEDHIGDEVRYKILSIGLGARGGKTKGTQ